VGAGERSLSEACGKSTNWPTNKQIEARASARATVVCQAIAAGESPIDALVEHDAELENLPAQVARQHKLNNPTREERLAGLDPEGVAIHRITKSMETVEVETTIDHLLRHANNLHLGENVLNTAARILDEFNKQSPEDWGSLGVRVRPRDAEPWAKMVLKFLSDSKQFLIKRNSATSTEERTYDPTNLREIERAGHETMARIAHIQKQLELSEEDE
jgi:hypothetical protein